MPSSDSVYRSHILQAYSRRQRKITEISWRAWKCLSYSTTCIFPYLTMLALPEPRLRIPQLLELRQPLVPCSHTKRVSNLMFDGDSGCTLANSDFSLLLCKETHHRQNCGERFARAAKVRRCGSPRALSSMGSTDRTLSVFTSLQKHVENSFSVLSQPTRCCESPSAHSGDTSPWIKGLRCGVDFHVTFVPGR